MKNIKHLLDVVDKVRDNVALGLMSDPGLSKTSQVKQWAEENGRRYCELIISQRMPSEISGMPMPVQDTKKMEVFDFDTLLQLEDGDVLAFDEFTNGNIQTLNACLTLIQERTMLSGKKLPSLVIVAMGNPQGRCDLLPQTKQRFLWVNVGWDPQMWTQYMRDTWKVTPSKKLLNSIGDQYKRGFAAPGQYNYMTPRTAENLIRIAMTIGSTDSFWKAAEFSTSIVESIYECFNGSYDQFVELRESMMEWVRQNPESEWASLIEMKLNACQTLQDIREFYEDLEKTNLAADFIEYLKTTDKSNG